MGVEYRAVQWNRQKKIYDAILISAVAVYLVTFGVVTKSLFPFVTDEIMLMRAFGSASFLLLNIILSIGPLCRLNPMFLTLLYNRRHAGVTMFTLGMVHAVLVVATYHAGSDTNPFLSIFVSSPINGSVSGVPFQPFGFFALVILFLMAATSHDFWLANLSAPVWKSLHMMVYVAYGLLVLHVTFGAMQGEGSPIYVGAVALGLITVLGLHIVAAKKESVVDREPHGRSRSKNPDHNLRDGHPASRSDESKIKSNRVQKDQHLISAAPLVEGYMDACAVVEIPENRARIVCLSGERVAIFKYDGKISAVSNVCQHQNGPLGEGKIVFGCITCPWHGYQYKPDTGASPPPFIEKVPTFNVRIRNGRVFVHPKPNLAGTRVQPANIEESRQPEEVARPEERVRFLTTMATQHS
jgi:nitrite reductase/ring-hydroxylating ferredoxin subunit/DMSO/TMAO reductase YedYZ heme-binding membrane subunit